MCGVSLRFGLHIVSRRGSSTDKLGNGQDLISKRDFLLLSVQDIHHSQWLMNVNKYTGFRLWHSGYTGASMLCF